MDLDEQTSGLLASIATADALPFHQMPLAQAREQVQQFFQAVAPSFPEAWRQHNRLIKAHGRSLPIAIYWPQESHHSAKLPALLVFHGGGFALGDYLDCEQLCRFFCQQTPAVVISLDYRLAPEHPFPAALDDASFLLAWVADNAEALGIDKSHLVVLGESAGANLAVALSHHTRDHQGPEIAMQVALYPWLDLHSHSRYASRQRYGGGDYFFSMADLKWLSTMYLGSKTRADNPYASPLLDSSFENLPPTLVISAGFDPLRDEALLYSQRLEQNGVPVIHRCFESTIHGFIAFAGALNTGKEGLEFVLANIRRQLTTIGHSQPSTQNQRR